jgi:hypothetical protein
MTQVNVDLLGPIALVIEIVQESMENRADGAHIGKREWKLVGHICTGALSGSDIAFFDEFGDRFSDRDSAHAENTDEFSLRGKPLAGT